MALRPFVRFGPRASEALAGRLRRGGRESVQDPGAVGHKKEGGDMSQHSRELGKVLRTELQERIPATRFRVKSPWHREDCVYLTWSGGPSVEDLERFVARYAVPGVQVSYNRHDKPDDDMSMASLFLDL